MMQCPLCNNQNQLRRIKVNQGELYYHCPNCQLIFAHPKEQPERKEEKERYLQHENSIDDEGYVRFLNQIIEPALEFIKPNAIGLDYGCGPNPTLSKLLEQKVITCYDYDPMFQINHPEKKYDFIFAVECFEHFHQPSEEIPKIIKLLKPGGHLFVMTERWQSLDNFADWYYIRDLTHVSFYHEKTFHFMENEFGLKGVFMDEERLYFLQKTP